MLKAIKRIILSCLSILGISVAVWTLLLLNPKWSYAHSTAFDHVEVYHNLPLSPNTEQIISDAVHIIQRSELFNEDIYIQLCMNDDSVYPNLYPFAGGPTAYAMLNKTVIKNCTTLFDQNVAQTQWAVNHNEVRHFNLTWLLAHEFMHNLQYHSYSDYVIKSTMGAINWKLEGHAEYVARSFQNDGLLREKITLYQNEASKEHIGLPVFELEDGTKQIFSYYKYALVVQYLIEQKDMDFRQICQSESSLEQLYTEMIAWSRP